MANITVPGMGQPMELGCGPADPSLSASQASYTGTGYNPLRGGTGKVGTINPGTSTPVTPGGVPAQTRALVQGGQLYIIDNTTGIAYVAGPAVGGPPQISNYSPTK